MSPHCCTIIYMTNEKIKQVLEAEALEAAEASLALQNERNQMDAYSQCWTTEGKALLAEAIRLLDKATAMRFAATLVGAQQ